MIMPKILKSFLLWGLSVGAVFSLQADMVSSEDALNAAEKWLETNFVARQSLDGCTVDSIASHEALYVVKLSPSGYIILPNSDVVSPIISFSKNPFVETEAESPFYAMLKASNESAVKAEAEGGERHARWVKLLGARKGTIAVTPKLAGSKIDSADMTEYVAPFMTTHWNQGQPWNDFSPQLSEAGDSTYRGRVPCGCVATAAAQMLCFWKWPYCDGEARTVTHSFRHDDISESIDLRYDGRVPFNWNSLVDTYSGFNGDSRGMVKESFRFPIARLVYWLDGALSMGYAQGGSGANLGAMSGELSAWYTPIKTYSRSSNHDAYLAKCREELTEGVPIGTSIPGHQIVGHGWATDGIDHYIYMNYGWGGSNDGWYEVDSDSINMQVMYYFRPRLKAQLEPLPAVSSSAVTLKWHFPEFYKNKITGFRLTREINGIEIGNFTEDFSTYEDGFVHWVPDQANELELSGNFGLTTRSVVELDASVKYGLDGTFSLMMREGEGAWESVYDWEYSVGGTTENRKIRVFLGDRAGKFVVFKLVNKRTGGRYYSASSRLLDFDDFKLTDVILPEAPTTISVSASTREYTFNNLIAGRIYSFVVTPKIADAEPSNRVSTRIAGTNEVALPGEETFTAKSYSYSTSNTSWTLSNSTYSSGTIATGVWNGGITYKTGSHKIGPSTSLTFKWTSGGYYKAGSSYDVLKVSFVDDQTNETTALYTKTNSAAQTTAQSVSVSFKKFADKKGQIKVEFSHSGAQNNYGGIKFTNVKLSNLLMPVLPTNKFKIVNFEKCDPPAILRILGPDGFDFDEGFYRDLVNGEEFFDVEVSESTTSLKAWPSHLYLLNDERVAVEKLTPTKYRVKFKPAERAFNRTRLIMTLEAENANGDKIYKDLSLRLDAEEKVLAIDNKRYFNSFGYTPLKTYLFEGSTGMTGSADAYIDAPFGKAAKRMSSSLPYTGLVYDFNNEFTVVLTARGVDTGNAALINLGSSREPYGVVLASGGTGKVTLSHWTTTGSAHQDLVTATVSDASTKFHAYVIRVKNKSAELWVDGVKRGTGTLAGYPNIGLQLFGIYAGIGKTGFTVASGAAIDELYIYQAAIPDAMIKAYSNLLKMYDTSFSSFVTTEGWEMSKSWVTKYYPGEKNYLARVNRVAANGQRIWECYKAGIDPTDPNAKFKISFELVNGKPVIKADPDLGSARTYTLYGSNDLKNWRKVTESTSDAYHFFRLSVEVK